MSRYIDADATLEYLDLMYEHQGDKDEPYNIGVLGATNYIKHKAPSIDIVFCKECECWEKLDYEAPKEGWCNDPTLYCDGRWTSADDFCSYGERGE